MASDCLTCGRCAARAERPGAAARFLALLSRIAAQARRRAAARRAIADLRNLDDHLLADIGLSDGAIRAVRRGSAAQLPPEPHHLAAAMTPGAKA